MSAVLLVDKPSGPTSHDIVYWARKVTGIKEIGHTGTLDPIASGLMMLVIGEATKLSQYLMDGDKEYEVLVELGKTSNTYDREGSIETTNSDIPDFGIIKETALNFKGSLKLQVPAFSAVKVDGKTLMERARKNEDAPIVIRNMDFYEVEILEFKCPLMRVRLKCNKGAYIRSWVHELGQKLGCGAMVKELRRTQNSGFHVQDAIVLSRHTPKEQVLNSSACVPIEKSLLNWPRILLNAEQEKRVRNGLIPSEIAVRAQNAISQSPYNEAFLQSEVTQKLTCIVSLNSTQKLQLNRVFTY